MSDALEGELDALFQLPAAEMVAARNVLVSRLKKAGEREAAARVNALKRPAPAAWAINQIYFRERELLEQALAEVARVRELQATEGLDRQQLAAAVAAQRVALQAVVDAALRNLEGAGLPHAGPHERRVFATVQGWLGGSGDEAPGRMTRELEPSGFEGLGQLGIPAPLPAATSSADRADADAQPSANRTAASASASGTAAAASANRTAAEARASRTAAEASANRMAASASASRTAAAAPSGARSGDSAPLQLRAASSAARSGPGSLAALEPPAPDPEELARRVRQQAEARVIERKQSFEWAQGRLVEQRKKQTVAEQALERAKHEVEDAERALALRRAAMSDRQTELSSRQQEVADADRARSAAEEALKQARAELAKL